MTRSVLLLALIALSCVAFVNGFGVLQHEQPAGAPQAASVAQPNAVNAPTASNSNPTGVLPVRGVNLGGAAQVPAPFIAAPPTTPRCHQAGGECQSQLNGSQQFCDTQAGDVLKAGLCGPSTTVKCCIFSKAPSTKRTRGPSSAYRRGQTGQLKDNNNRHHAKSSGRFQNEQAHGKNGQLFDRRTGQFKKAATGAPAQHPTKGVLPVRGVNLNGGAAQAQSAPQVAAPFIAAPPNTPGCLQAGGECQSQFNGSQQFCNVKGGDHFAPGLCGASASIKCCVFAKAATPNVAPAAVGN